MILVKSCVGKDNWFGSSRVVPTSSIGITRQVYDLIANIEGQDVIVLFPSAWTDCEVG